MKTSATNHFISTKHSPVLCEPQRGEGWTCAETVAGVTVSSVLATAVLNRAMPVK
jgi:hypothetical protein